MDNKKGRPPKSDYKLSEILEPWSIYSNNKLIALLIKASSEPDPPDPPRRPIRQQVNRKREKIQDNHVYDGFVDGELGYFGNRWLATLNTAYRPDLTNVVKSKLGAEQPHNLKSLLLDTSQGGVPFEPKEPDSISQSSATASSTSSTSSTSSARSVFAMCSLAMPLIVFVLLFSGNGSGNQDIANEVKLYTHEDLRHEYILTKGQENLIIGFRLFHKKMGHACNPQYIAHSELPP